MKFDYPREDRIPQLRQVWKDSFGDTDAFLDLFFSTGFHPRRCRCAVEEGRVVAALYWFDIHWSDLRCAYLYAVATDPQYRGRGLCRNLMEDTAAVLTAAGYDGALLVPQEDGLIAMYGKMGYLPATSIREEIHPAGNTPVAFQEIAAPEYAEARIPLLPPCSVIQDGNNLPFFAAIARFYRGAGFLAAVSREQEHLRILEFLGDISQAAGLIRALGHTEATLRTPGRRKPFAMYRSLSAHCSKPDYFAFPFD